MIRRPPRSTPLYSSAASDVYKRQPEYLLTQPQLPLEKVPRVPSKDGAFSFRKRQTPDRAASGRSVLLVPGILLTFPGEFPRWVRWDITREPNSTSASLRSVPTVQR